MFKSDTLLRMHSFHNYSVNGYKWILIKLLAPKTLPGN